MTEPPRKGRQHREVSQREVLRWTGAAAVAGTLGPVPLASVASSSSAAAPSAELDAAIIGGGPPGLNAAYCLLTGTLTERLMRRVYGLGSPRGSRRNRHLALIDIASATLVMPIGHKSHGMVGGNRPDS
jgi:hypothetical protein